MAEGIENPILNGPYDAPSRHFELGPNGPTGTILDGRRPSESFIPVPAPRKGKNKGQQALDLDVSGERREKNDLINEIRYHVGLWRQRGYPGVTPISRKLLQHWADPNRENRVMFCQREAAETAIFLAEVSGRQGTPDFRQRLDAENALHNNRLPRVGLKMATGTGKTVVMAMLIAWQTINKVYSPRDARFSKRFLVVTPGITIRDRLRVIQPNDPDNYYRQRDLVPGDLWAALGQAEIIIANYHAFLPRTAKEMQGVAANTRKILTYGKKVDPFVETGDQIVARVLRSFGGKGKLNEIVVLNDEAHHCYQNRSIDDEELDKDERERNEDARRWFIGLQQVAKKVGIKNVYDLSATPYYLQGSGYNEGYIFPWVVSDFSLMDAIESGIVKVPRVPVDDDAASHLVTYLRLWDHVGTRLPKRAGKKAGTDGDWVPPDTLEGAMRSLYRSYAASFERWERTLKPLGEPPPVIIVVCPNTIVSKLVYDWIAGADIEAEDGTIRVRKGELELLSNVADGAWLTRPRTVLIDSAQLESGESMKDDFKKAAAHEIEAFKSEIRRRDPGADVDNLTDEDLMREVMNTVGKKGKLGEGVRCVVSVSMLTEGWDANTVTHILGVRAFGSQLLCEQVVGRGLRRRDYSINDDGKFEPEYAEVYGVPFAFIPTDRVLKPITPKSPAVEVRALPERAHLRITFPKLTGYRVELSPTPLAADFTDESKLHVDKTSYAARVDVEGIVGEGAEHRLADTGSVRPQQVAYELAKQVLANRHLGLGGVPIHTRFPQLVKIAKDWLAECVTYEPGCDASMLVTIAEWRAKAAERLENSIVRLENAHRETLRPVLDRFDSVGTTDHVSFMTRKVVIDTVKSPINRVTLDGIKGNSWEETVAHRLEKHPEVVSYVKNDGLDFMIPYLHAGVQYDYKPDFLLRLGPRDADDETERYLIIEVSGTRKDQDKREAKAEAAEHRWCAAVNNHGGFGRWGYVEISNMKHAESAINEAINRLHMNVLEAALAD
ncbi:MAG: DEAD/DEAH box helicase family protein [Acidimicrobiales bacterium]|nr:DEAD/DEAH box helicase family protein [Acidimicrobiales bacterium]MCB9382776.1 DEAD/DEAH box helicase family protein [Acidimicrobiaceae bacterium]